MRRLIAAFLGGFLVGGFSPLTAFAAKGDTLAVQGTGSLHNTDVLRVDPTNSRVLVDQYHLRVGTGSTPDVTPGADDVFIEGTLEVDGAARFDGAATFSSGVTVPTVDITVTTPTVAGVLVQTSAHVLYISTSTTGIGNWIKVGAQ